MVKFIADSSCDIITYSHVDYTSIPMSISTDERSFIDDGSIDINEMLDYLENFNGRSYTACPSVDQWVQAYEGGDEIYVITITSGLSGTYNSARVAKEMFLADHPDAKIEIFDSLSTGPEMKMALDYAISLKEKGCSFEETCSLVHEYLDKTHLLFVLASVHNLAVNGRINKMIASAIGVLKINVIGIADEAGTIKQVGKARGDKKVISTLMNKLEENHYAGGKVNIGHVQNEKLAASLKKAILAKYPEANVEFYPSTALCSYYAERAGILVGFETV